MNCFAKLYGVLEHLLVRLREKKDKPAFANIMKFRKHLFLKPVLTVLSCFLRCGRWILLFDVAYSWLFGVTKLYNPGFIDRWSPMSNHFLTRCPSLFHLAFHISVLFHSLFTCHWISSVFLLYDRRICTQTVDPSLTHFLGEFPGLVLAPVPDVVVPEAEQGCAWSRNLDPKFCTGRGRTSDLGI